jgi:hypothetical protein
MAQRSVSALHPPRCLRHARFVPLSTSLPQEITSLAAYVAGHADGARLDCADRLSVMLRYVAGPMRYEPLNTYAVHRTVPSARCQFPHRLMLLTRAGTRVRLYRYLSEHHALEDCGDRPDLAAILGQHMWALVGVGQFWAIADKYGEFSPFATALEAGMAQAQLEHLARAMHMSATALEHDAHCHRAASALCSRDDEAVMYGLRCNSGDMLGQFHTDQQDGLIADISPSAELDRRFVRLNAISRLFAAPANQPPVETGRVGRASSVPKVPDLGLLQIMRTRHSGNDAPGMAPNLRPLPDDTLPSLLGLWRAFERTRAPLPCESLLTVAVIWLGDDCYPAGLFDINAQPWPQTVRPEEVAHRLQSALPHPHMRYNMAALKASVVILADPVNAIAMHGDAALRRLHLAAGAMAQDFSLAAAALRLFARPVRMLSEQRLEAGFNLPAQPIYQLLCGLNRSTNTAWDLL